MSSTAVDEASAIRPKPKFTTMPTVTSPSSATMPLMISEEPNVGRGFLRITWNEPTRIVPRVMGWRGTRPGFGGGVHPGPWPPTGDPGEYPPKPLSDVGRGRSGDCH